MFLLRLKKIFNFFINLLYLGGIFGAPLFFSIFPKTFNVFELNKIVFLKIIILLLSFFVFSKILLFKDSRERFKNIFKYKFLLIPFFYLLGLAFIVFFSDFRYMSFSGSYYWQLGLISYIYFFVFFLLSIFIIKDRKYLFKVIGAILLSSFFVCIYGLVQFLGLDPLRWIESSSHRIISTQGQPNFLASYLLLVSPLSLFVFYYYKNIYLKLFSIVVFFLQIFCIFGTHSRGAYLSLLLGSLFFLFIFFFYAKKDFYYFLKKKNFYYFLFIFLLIFIFFFFSLDSIYKDRLLSVFNLQSGSVASRIDYWESGLDAFMKKPFWGYGLDNHKNIFVKYYDKDWALFNDVNAVPSRAHNIILEKLLNGGIFIFVLWFLMMFSFVKISFKNIKNNKLILAILLGFLYYFLSLLFSFSTVTTVFYMWLYLAILFVLHENNFLLKEEKAEEVIEKWDIKKGLILLVKCLFLLILFSVVFLHVVKEQRKIFADIYYLKMQEAFRDKEIFETYVLYDYIQEVDPNELLYKRKMVDFLSGEYVDFSEEVKKRPGEKILRDILEELPPTGFYNIVSRAKILSALAVNEKDFQLADEEFEKAISLSNNIPYLHREYAKFLYRAKRYDEALKEIDVAFNKLPELSDNRLNRRHFEAIGLEHYQNYVLRGDIYFEENYYELAEENYKKAAAFWGSNNYYIVKKIIASMLALDKREKAVDFLIEKFEKDSGNFYWPYLLATVKVHNKEKEEAIFYINKALELSPNNSFLQKFKQKINEN